jgi:hypothetical protein
VTRTGVAVLVAVSAPLGAVLAVMAVSLAAWAEYRLRRPLRIPWDRY